MSFAVFARDVIVVASVSCIYGIGSKEDYEEMIIPMRVGSTISREQFLSRLISLQYERNDNTFEREIFACVATPSKSVPPDAKMDCAWNFFRR